MDIASHDPSRFESVLDPDTFKELKEGIETARELLDGRVVWNVNSTAKGGGVVELLIPLLGYARGAGIDARWTVITGDQAFFKVTKRIHNHLHGFEGDKGELGEAEHEAYEKALEASAEDLADSISEGDVVILHDPQTAGLVKPLKDAGACVIWRCHVGLDTPNDVARGAWAFLSPYVEPADAYIFSREVFAWEGLDENKITLIAPTIDAFSPKNQALEPDNVAGILAAAGIFDAEEGGDASFDRGDGSTAEVSSKAEIFEDTGLGPDDRVVLQVSRWDRLKDPEGVIKGFAEHASAHETGAHLIYAGPSVEAVSDDPEGAEVLEEAKRQREQLSDEARKSIHLVCLPMDDAEENAIIVNALQRHASVVVQKSIAEGFGLTVAEAMWKARPVVATKVGGIQDQIVDGESGVLIDDPRDLDAYGAAVRELLEDPERAERIGEAAKERVRGEFLGSRSLLDYLQLISKLVS